MKKTIAILICLVTVLSFSIPSLAVFQGNGASTNCYTAWVTDGGVVPTVLYLSLDVGHELTTVTSSSPLKPTYNITDQYYSLRSSGKFLPVDPKVYFDYSQWSKNGTVFRTFYSNSFTTGYAQIVPIDYVTDARRSLANWVLVDRGETVSYLRANHGRLVLSQECVPFTFGISCNITGYQAN